MGRLLLKKEADWHPSRYLLSLGEAGGQGREKELRPNDIFRAQHFAIMKVTHSVFSAGHVIANLGTSLVCFLFTSFGLLPEIEE
jgi:hypothetical protein